MVVEALSENIAQSGFAFVGGSQMRSLLEAAGPLSDWEPFSASWERLALDNYMADEGRYRRRRHGCFLAQASGELSPLPHRAHYQSLAYNTLNGGIERWFEPLEPEVAQGACLGAILHFCVALFRRPGQGDRLIEVHQFRIEARAAQPGLPTPEGVHRDGVEHVAVLLIQRRNVSSGTTTIHRVDGSSLGAFTLAEPLDAALLDDERVYHGVTAIEPVDPSQPGYRDVLVVTLRRA
jgi:hypothetical protein